MKISDGCQYVNKGPDLICYWWNKTYLGAPGYEWGCFCPHKMDYLKFVIEDKNTLISEPFMDCPLQEIWFWCMLPKFEMHHTCECGSTQFYHPNKNQTRFKCWKCGACYV